MHQKKFNYPESTVVCINVIFDKSETENNVITGSGVMIGPNTVLTCAHLFYVDDTARKEDNTEYEYARNGKIKKVKVAGDLEERLDNTQIGNSIVYNASEVYIESNYMDSIAELERNVSNKVYSIDIGDADYVRKSWENDLAVIKLDGDLGNSIGWIGILPFEAKGSGTWGTLYGYPDRVPSLPDLNVMASYLKKDLRRTKKEGLSSNSGLIIYLNNAVDAMNENGSALNKKYYTGLLKDNGFEMYSSYSKLGYGPYFPKLLEYQMSSYGGESGGPIIQNVYNSFSGRYVPYTSGVHLGYCREKNAGHAEYGDLYMYVEDFRGKMINFRDSYEESVPEVDVWHTSIGVYGKNYGRQIDKQLYNYLLANDLYPGYNYEPKDRVVK